MKVAGKGVKAGKAAPKACFPAGTAVWTDEGLVPIEDIEAGEFVACADAESSDWSYCEVEERLEHRHDGELVSVTAAGHSVEATGNHPFWVVSGDDLEFRPVATDAGADALGGDEDGRWVEARAVEPGDRVLLADGREVAVELVSFSSGSLPVFNLHVAGRQTYAVGEAGVLVHNKANVSKPAKVLQSGGRTLKNRTLKDLGLGKEQGKRAIEGLKRDGLLRNDAHGKILSDGSVQIGDDVVGNLFDYVP